MKTTRRKNPAGSDRSSRKWIYTELSLWMTRKKYERALSEISTLVRGLEEKGFVKYRAYGNTYQYYAAISDKEYKRSALNDVVAQYYNNSYTNVVSTFIEEEGMSVYELKALIAEIESKKSNR